MTSPLNLGAGGGEARPSITTSGPEEMELAVTSEELPMTTWLPEGIGVMGHCHPSVDAFVWRHITPPNNAAREYWGYNGGG